jgi:hypothetical protein
MIRTMVAAVRTRLVLSLHKSFSRDFTPISKVTQEDIDLEEWQRMLESSHKHVMRNYDTVLPGLFRRNDELIEE